jgi:sugar O-acyltransferase (sialic acid O-acetyltransferase NeuD family)
MSAAIFVFGAGGHGKVVADVAISAGLRIDGFLDDNPELLGREVLGKRILGGFDFLRQSLESGSAAVVLGVGSNSARRAIATRCLELGAVLQTAIHRSASVAQSALVGAGTVVMAGAAINPDASVGRGVIVNTGAVVEHDCEVGDYAHLSPNSALGGGARLGAHASLGLCACVLPGISVGEGTVVGAGAVVVAPVPASSVAVGVPARVVRALRSGE